ncbi:hypothetical protein SZ00_00001 [Rhodococcus sp. AD45]|nr:hypothetical protein SZ00_00001 [Rhodococcus sp. AD45]
MTVIRNTVSLLRSSGPTFSGGIAMLPSLNSEYRMPNISCSVVSRRTMLERNTPNAIVAKARYNPRRRSAGNATRPPMTAVTSTPTTMPHRFRCAANPLPEIPKWNATMVAMAPKETGAKFNSPAYPVSNVSESAMIANVIPIVNVVIADVTISRRSRYTMTMSATPQMTALRTDGT